MSKARELANLGNAYSDGALSNRNLIINGAMQVWQRGTSFTTGFTADRWVVGSVSSATKVSSSLTGFGSAIRIVTSAGDPKFYQDIENYEGYLAGQTMTLSFWMKTDIADPFHFGQYCEWYDGSNTYGFFAVDVPVVIETRGDWKRYARTFTLPSNATGYKFNVRLDFNEGTSQTVEITGVQLEVGDTATPFEHRSYGDELARCQRYYSKISSVDCCGYYVTAQNAPTFNFSYPQPMRATPTITINRQSNDSTNLSSITQRNQTADSFNLYLSGLSTGMVAFGHNGNEANFEMDSEL